MFLKKNNEIVAEEDLEKELQYFSYKIKEYLPLSHFAPIEKALHFANEAHKSQKRLSGEAYLRHPIEVAKICTELKLDIASICAALLHDTVEDTQTSLDEIKEKFGDEVASIVDGLTKLQKITFTSRIESQAENFRKMLLAMAKDLRVIVIKLADRLHNMKTLEAMPEEKRLRISQETLDIYAPLAHRLGINWVKSDLEDLSLKYLKPEIYFKLAEKIVKSQQERNNYIENVLKILEENLKKYNIKFRVYGRPKHVYSVYKKMEFRNVEFEQIYDLIAFRIIVESIKDCYEVLGIIHSLWKPIPGKFKDYIALPKPNLYQSLHSILIGPKGERVEVQIRTEEMHKIAEEGVAAHWAYKEKKKINQQEMDTFNWIKQLLEWKDDLVDSNEFLQTVKTDLFAEDVYVFTPRGDVKEFPRGATPIDFAYSVHTDVGHRCVGAKINNRIVPLRYKLQNGDVVEIITNPNHHPTKDWLKMAFTSRAKTKIRQVVQIEERKASHTLGEEVLEKELKKYNFSIAQLEKIDKLDNLASLTKHTSFDDLLVALGYGKADVKKIIEKILPESARVKKVEDESFIESIIKKVKRKSSTAIKVKGVDDILVKFGRCCSPIYGDQIVGYITRGRGITVHTIDCPKALDMDKERRVDVEWDRKEKTMRNVRIRVFTIDMPGILAQLTKEITNIGSNIIQASIRTTNDKKAINSFEITIEDSTKLYYLLKNIEKIKGVIAAERYSG